jgi:hypothetical protein
MIGPFEPTPVRRFDLSRSGRFAQICCSRIERLTRYPCQLSQPSHFWEGWRFCKSLILADSGGLGGVGWVFAHSDSYVRVRVRARVVVIYKNPPNPPNPPICFLFSFVHGPFRSSIAFAATLPTLPTLPFLESDFSAVANREISPRSTRGSRTEAHRPCPLRHSKTFLVSRKSVVLPPILPSSHFREDGRVGKLLIALASGACGGNGSLFALSDSRARVCARARESSLQTSSHSSHPPILDQLDLCFRSLAISLAYLAILPFLPFFYLILPGAAAFRLGFSGRQLGCANPMGNSQKVRGGSRARACTVRRWQRICLQQTAFNATLFCTFFTQVSASRLHDRRGNSPRVFARLRLVGNFPTSRPRCSDRSSKTVDTFKNFPGSSLREAFQFRPPWGNFPQGGRRVAHGNASRCPSHPLLSPARRRFV